MRDFGFLRALLAAAGVAIMALAAPSPASAQSSGAERALELGYEADTLFARGKWAEAYERFAEADALAHSPVFVLYMARARRNDGKLLEATEIYARVAAEELAPDAPKPFRDAVADASAEHGELQERIPAIVVEVKKPEGVEVVLRLDGEPVREGVRVRLDPGRHVVVAVAEGREEQHAFEIGEGEDAIVYMDLLRTDALAPGEASEGSLVPGVLLISAGAVGIGLGAVFGGLAASDASSVKEGCIDDSCLASDADQLDRARTFATVSTIGFVAGGVLAAAGVVLVVIRPGGSDGPTLTAGPGHVALRGSF